MKQNLSSQGITSVELLISHKVYKLQMTLLIQLSFMCGSDQRSYNISRNETIDKISNLLGQVGTFYTYPCYHMGSNFYKVKFDKRPWFILAQQQYEQFHDLESQLAVTKPYQLPFKDAIAVSLTIPQEGPQQVFDGAWAAEINNDIFKQLISQNDQTKMVMIVEQSGILIVDNFTHNNTEFNYFYDQNLTGFNKTDWEIVQQNDVKSSNCNNSLLVRGYLCRFNSLYQSDIHIISIYEQKLGFYIIMLYDTTPFKMQQNENHLEIVSLIQNTLVSFIQLMLFWFGLLIILFNQFIIQIPLRPIIGIVNSLKKSLYLCNQYSIPNFKKLLEERKRKSKPKKGLLQSLVHHYVDKRLKQQYVKCEECKAIEDYHYQSHSKYWYQYQLEVDLEQLPDVILEGESYEGLRNQDLSFYQDIVSIKYQYNGRDVITQSFQQKKDKYLPQFPILS